MIIYLSHKKCNFKVNITIFINNIDIDIDSETIEIIKDDKMKHSISQKQSFTSKLYQR